MTNFKEGDWIYWEDDFHIWLIKIDSFNGYNSNAQGGGLKLAYRDNTLVYYPSLTGSNHWGVSRTFSGNWIKPNILSVYDNPSNILSELCKKTIRQFLKDQL